MAGVRLSLKRFTGLLTCCLVAAVAVSAAQRARADTVTEFEVDVYAELLKRLARGLPRGQQVGLVVASGTVSVEEAFREIGPPLASLSEDIAWRLPEASKKAVEDLLRRSERKADVKLKMNVAYPPLSVHPIPEAELSEIMTTADSSTWQRFSAAHDGARYIVHFSRVGFDANSIHAIVFTSLTCPGLCGAGELILLRRENGEWRIVNTHQLWIS